MEEIFLNNYAIGVLTWISGLSATFIFIVWLNRKLQKRSLIKINKRIQFIDSHKTYIKRLEYGILSLLYVLAIIATIFIFEYSYRNEEDRALGRNFQLLISFSAYFICLYRAVNFKDLINARKVLGKLNEQKIMLEDKVEKKA